MTLSREVERLSPIRSGERILGPHDVDELVKNNPILKILNPKTLSAKFNNGKLWDVTQYDPISLVNVQTADGVKEYIFDGFHRLAVWYTGREQFQKQFPNFQFSARNITDSFLTRPDLIPFNTNQTALTPEQFAKILVEPTNAQPEISVKRKTAHIIELWNHKIGHILAQKYPALYAFIAIEDNIEDTSLFKETTAQEKKQLLQGLTSIRQTLPHLSLSTETVVNECLVFLATSYDKPEKIPEDNLKHLESILTLPKMQQKLEEQAIPVERRTLLIKQLARQISTLAQKSGAIKLELNTIRKIFQDSLLSFDDILSIFQAPKFKTRYQAITQQRLEEHITQDYLRHTNRSGKLSSLEQKVISQSAQDSSVPKEPENIVKTIQTIEAALAPAKELYDKLLALQSNHPSLREPASFLKKLMNRLVSYPTLRETTINTLTDVINNLESQITALSSPLHDESKQSPPQNLPVFPLESSENSVISGDPAPQTITSLEEKITQLERTLADEQQQKRIMAQQMEQLRGERDRAIQRVDLLQQEKEPLQKGEKRTSDSPPASIVELKIKIQKLQAELAIAQRGRQDADREKKETEQQMEQLRREQQVAIQTADELKRENLRLQQLLALSQAAISTEPVIEPQQSKWEKVEKTLSSRDGRIGWFQKLAPDSLPDNERDKITVIINNEARKLFSRFTELNDEVLPHGLQPDWNHVLENIIDTDQRRGFEVIEHSFSPRLTRVAKDLGWGKFEKFQDVDTYTTEFIFACGAHFRNILQARLVGLLQPPENQMRGAQIQAWVNLMNFHLKTLTIEQLDPIKIRPYLAQLLQLLVYSDHQTDAYLSAVHELPESKGPNDLMMHINNLTNSSYYDARSVEEIIQDRFISSLAA